MYRLTTKRLQKATDILEKYRSKLLRTFQFDAMSLECELRECWNLGYRELKSIFEDMLKNERYRYVAIFYMENPNGPGVVSEFQSPLAKVYGIKHYDAPEREQRRKELWGKFKARSRRPEQHETGTR